MSREQLQALAQETVEISRAGRYTLDGKVILFDAARPTELWTAQDLDSLVRESARPAEGPSAAIEVRGEGTVDAVFRLAGGEVLLRCRCSYSWQRISSTGTEILR